MLDSSMAISLNLYILHNGTINIYPREMKGKKLSYKCSRLLYSYQPQSGNNSDVPQQMNN